MSLSVSMKIFMSIMLSSSLLVKQRMPSKMMTLAPYMNLKRFSRECVTKL